jgi:hypothetical protein
LFSLSSDRRKAVGGEVLNALAYDVPIPGYKTKNAISLRLWDAKASAEDFNLFQFNDGQYESAAQLHSRAQQVIWNPKLSHSIAHISCISWPPVAPLATWILLPIDGNILKPVILSFVPLNQYPKFH